MPEKIITTDPPQIDEDDFEDFLATDDLFVDYFNAFLRLPSFPEPLRFNSDSGGFEVLSNAKHEIAEKIKAAARTGVETRSQMKKAADRYYQFARESDEKDEEIKTCFSVKCLDKEQGIQWIKEERLPSFLRSELYMEYRLAKLLSQIETSPGGIKLTIDPDFRPWYKPEMTVESPAPVDETEAMIQRMFVTLGMTPTTQMKEWYTVTKNTEVESTTISPSRPLSSATVTTGAWARPNSSSRPDSVQSTRLDIAEDSSRYLDSGMWTGAYTESHITPVSRKSKSTVTFDTVSISPSFRTSLSGNKTNIGSGIAKSSVPINIEDAACILKTSSIMEKVGQVARIEPESDEESDQGMGSECDTSDDSEHLTETTRTTKETESEEYGLELRSLDDYSSVFVALSLKKALLSLDNTLRPSNLDDMSFFKEIIPKPRDWLIGLRGAKTPVPISHLDEKMFAEAILAQERRVLEDMGKMSRKSVKYNRFGKFLKLSKVHSVQQGDVLDLLDAPKRKITFHDNVADDSERQSKAFSTTSSETDEKDSIFSEPSDDLDPNYVMKVRKYNFIDVKGFSKFKEFVENTVGRSVMNFWIDIDKSRFAIPKMKFTKYLTELRERYLRVGSDMHIPIELMKKWNLHVPCNWTVKYLQKMQQTVVESLLLYWAPRFLIRQAGMVTDLPSAVTTETKLQRRFPVKDMRPTSSQSYPTPKTVIIRPLRPKSCLPRIKMKQVEPRPGEDKRSFHVMDMYQQLSYHPKYQHQMYHLLKFKPQQSNITTLKRHKLNRFGTKPLARPVSAGPLTAGNLAIFEHRRQKSAKALSQSDTQAFYIKPVSSRALDSHSVSSVQTATSVTSKSTLRGSEPMESMLQALYYDTRAGWFFTRFCEQSNNKMWNNAIHFWFEAQDYHKNFYTKVVDEFVIRRKAQVIYSKYIVVGAPEDIGVSLSIRKKIHLNLDPPFDEVFDEAEELILKLLIIPWNEMLGADQASYKKVEQIEQERNLQVASKYLSFLQKKGIIKEKRSTIESEWQGEEKYEEDLWAKVPEEFRNVTFDEIVRNRIELEHLRKFLEENYAKTDLLCWLDIESFKRVPHQATEKRDEKAKDIRIKYLHKKYFFGPSSPANKEQQNKVVQAAGGWGMTLKERPPNEMITEAQKYVQNRLQNRWLPRFLATKAYQDRQHPKSQMSDVAEDVILQKKKKRGEPWKLLDNRWQTSSREIVEFRHALTNPVTASQFRRYVSVKGDLLENDVLFWLEVQKYKDFCHAHNEQSAIEGKITAIINCFLDSLIPPTLQIDIPSEMADRIVEKRRELGPYVFREAQLTVFRVLFPHWSGFCEFRKNLSDEKLTTTLERQRAKKLERMRRQIIQQHNEQIAKEEAAAAKEREAAAVRGRKDSLADLLSTAGSDAAESVISFGRVVPSNQIKWSYGKYIEGLDRERNLLLMENEIKGHVPPEPLPERDPDVSTIDSNSMSDGDSSESNDSRTTSDVTGSINSQSMGKRKKSKKKKKDKIIYSTIPEVTTNQSAEYGDYKPEDVKTAIAKQSGKVKSEGRKVKINGSKLKPKGATNGSGDEKTKNDDKKPTIIIN